MKKILVCDDDESILDAVKIVLRNNNYNVNTISSGKKILKAVKNYSPDLILLDNSMPALDTRKLIKLIKKEKRLKDIPVIMFSAFNNLATKALDLGVDGFIEKPFDMGDFLKIIEKHIKRD